MAKPLMFNKICWLDTETTGLSPWKHDIIQIAMIIDIDGEEVARRSWKVRPHKGKVISPNAVKTHGISIDELRSFPSHKIVYNEVMDFLDAYRDQGRFIIGGYNVKFDWDFMKQWVFSEIGNDKHFWFRFYGHVIDVRQTACEAGIGGMFGDKIENLKLESVYSMMKDQLPVKLNAHEASSDIEVTRALYRLFKAYETGEVK